MAQSPSWVWDLFTKLRRRQFPVGPDDYLALREALRAGFGWSSRAALRALCCALWAKSRREQEVLGALFDQLDLPDWRLPRPAAEALPATPARTEETPGGPDVPGDLEGASDPPVEGEAEVPEPVPAVEARGGLPPIHLGEAASARRAFVLVPQFPLTYREVAQAWRRLRRPVRFGPPAELDGDATVAAWARRGPAGGVVLVPRRRNTARLLLLVDRQGSMAPCHRFVEEVCAAILEAGRLESAALYYFHDVPAEGADLGLLRPVAGELFPTLDPVLADIPPLDEGCVYQTPELLGPVPLAEVLARHAAGAAVVLVSDAGAARGRYDAPRLLDTVAFLKALRGRTSRAVWLNPFPRRYWARSTCAQIARHIPMFPLDRLGIHHAVNVARGQVYRIERPL